MDDQVKYFCVRLAERFADIKNILKVHVADYEELLPHVFMADVTRYVVDDGPEKVAVVQYLEDAFARRGKAVEELLAVSFVENIESVDALNGVLNDVRGNALRQEWERQHEG